jgi:hypothetical protein
MSKTNKGDQPLENAADYSNPDVPIQEIPPEQNPDAVPAPEAEGPKQDDPPKPEKGELLTVEDHAKRLHITAPVFAAVLQSQKWASGKKVFEAEFKEAVKAFLNAPIGGVQ